MTTNRMQMPRSIHHRCQLCGGELACIRKGELADGRWVCTVCRSLWRYGVGGWTRMKTLLF